MQDHNDSTDIQNILEFWFQQHSHRWWDRNPRFDAHIAEKWAGLMERAQQGGLMDWESFAEGALAKIILLDQFSRNAYRGSARAFEYDREARRICLASIEKGFDSQLVSDQHRKFLLLPLLHAEDMNCQQMYLAKGGQKPGCHYLAISKFGRFPGRNKALGRTSTPAELAYLRQGGFP
eukprot:TRINITY_DN15748_c0_g1_i1.p1 TRINITY_DN15748_c0_g1~~TRINITY_DN15748_c0_g1_i1.p1  ORF type:complete len:204 (+),score=27.52 TRINITY_DN15748_c0_g1_i1:80-613(+)